MAKKMLIDATHAEETRVVVVDGNKVEEFDFESENKRQLAGNIYLAKVTRVEPSLQAAFVDYGGNRHGFLAFSEIHPDYYQIPVADREKLLAEEAEYAKAMAEEDERREKSRKSRRPRRKKSEAAANTDEVITSDVIDMDADGDDSGLVDVPEADVIETPAEADAPVEGTEDAPNPEAEAVEAETTEETPAEEETTSDEDTPSEDTPSEDDEATKAAKETVAEEDAKDEDDSDEHARAEFRPRKPRPRRYKIQEVVKVRQILLVQVVKEERGNKGAALTTYLSLAGRYCVLMPNTARGGGISRKITNAPDRKKLKEIANEIEVPEGAGLIIRTAGAKRTKTEIKRDYEYLLRQWEQVRDLTLKSIAPAAIYEEGDLIKRSIRDLYNREIDEILVEGEAGFKTAKDYMTMLMPTRVDRVKHYRDTLPLFSRFQVETYLDGMFNPTVQLKSGGYIVIGITEALVAIDVNSGKATKEGSIEDTALRTNLEAAEEVARQLKLRDLAGLIVIDFIDMEERRNNSAVEKRMKDKLKNDRARIQVGRISGFGLMEMSRQRLRPGMLEATTQPCAACHGTGLVRSNDNIALLILRELEEEGTRKRSREVLVTCPVDIANYLLNEKREHITMLEARYGMAIRIESDPHMISPDHKMEKFKSSTRRIPKAPAQAAVTIDSVEPFEMEEEAETPNPEAENTDEQPKKKRRRRRRRGGKDRNESQAADAQNADTADGEATSTEGEATPAEATEADAKGEAAPAAPPVPEEATEEAPKKSRTTRRRAPAKKKEEAAPVEAEADASTEEATPKEAEAAPEEKPAKPARKPRTRKPSAKKLAEEAAAAEAAAAEAATPAEDAKPEVVEIPIETAPEPTPEPAPEPVAEAAPEPEAPPAKPKPKRSGWWSRATGKG
ncbi:ribonuclease E/G [Amylibacter sp. IMCC11727]|uniref:Rne/Rng family ribonuclease n=1 Tax=Amylibacter sp. IMCC11727 TaxID=3039851 RepID=UPI00244E3DFC|nr:ribonuclease E/G [Amylibacter sp. IMCC11727]WGI20655.1 ribonuclease E/G [Amylibacter sp. IMCC11727]